MASHGVARPVILPSVFATAARTLVLDRSALGQTVERFLTGP
jgi:hypothetical protein